MLSAAVALRWAVDVVVADLAVGDETLDLLGVAKGEETDQLLAVNMTLLGAEPCAGSSDTGPS